MMEDSDCSGNSLTDCDTDLDSEEDIEKDAGEVDEERKSCALQVSSKPVRKAFSDEQVTCLRDHYKRGMIGVGRKYDDLIETASEESGLTVTQVKVSLALKTML
jgi:hypothetical protein